jgi:hypothetical protein
VAAARDSFDAVEYQRSYSPNPDPIDASSSIEGPKRAKHSPVSKSRLTDGLKGWQHLDQSLDHDINFVSAEVLDIEGDPALVDEILAGPDSWVALSQARDQAGSGVRR